MQSSRYKDETRETSVRDDRTIKEQEKIRQTHEREELRRLKKEQKREELMSSRLFNLLYKIKHFFDDWYLDALIGLIPTAGDIVTAFLSFPFIMFCLFKVRSIALTLAVLNNYMLDMIIGLIPFGVGNISDFFYKAHRKNLDLIMGYIDDDKNIIEKINRKAVISAIVLLVLIFTLVMMIKFVAYISEWFLGLFN